MTTTITFDDAEFMAQAIRLAEKGKFTVTPNPCVGCVLVRNGKVIGRGWHMRAGEPHAEIHALKDAVKNNEPSAGATCYVTLEPCSHTGRTGPCADALIAAGIVRVVYAMEDPNFQVAGTGFEKLREAGITIVGPVCEEDARALNKGFIKRMLTGRPWVCCKMAMSLDGRTAMASGESKWITARRAREDVQRLRAQSCAIISGIETLLGDKAVLNVRLDDWPNAPMTEPRQPLRVVLDSKQRLPLDSPFLQQTTSALLVHAGSENLGHWPEHVECISLPDKDGRVDLSQLLNTLGERGCNEVLLEAGATLAGSFLRRGLLDEIIIYMAPKLMGSNARPLFDLPINKMVGQLPLKITDIRAVGADWRITAIPDTDS